jgi:hypothetical protein
MTNPPAACELHARRAGMKETGIQKAGIQKR